MSKKFRKSTHPIARKSRARENVYITIELGAENVRPHFDGLDRALYCGVIGFALTSWGKCVYDNEILFDFKIAFCMFEIIPHQVKFRERAILPVDCQLLWNWVLVQRRLQPSHDFLRDFSQLQWYFRPKNMILYSELLVATSLFVNVSHSLGFCFSHECSWKKISKKLLQQKWNEFASTK
jgi:hypothetical protein